MIVGLWTPAEIKALRLAHRQTIRQFAATLRVHRDTVCRWETGRNRPPPAYTELLDRALDRAGGAVYDRMLEILAQWSEA